MHQLRSVSQKSFVAALAMAILTGTADVQAEDMVQVPSPNGTMVTEVDRPAGNGPFPVVIFSHGRDGDPAGRARLAHPVNGNVVSFWIKRGYAVVAPIRPGYGLSGGADFEDSLNRHYTVTPDYRRTARGAATGIEAAVQWVRQQSWAKPDRIILHGQSVGGLGTVAAAADNPPGVVAFINFAGGSGGNPKETPGRSCQPEVLTSLYGSFGGSTRLPGIWFYASNDEYWGPQAPREWGAAFNGSGGHARLVFTGPVPNGRGHSLLATAPQLWQGELTAFLNAHKL
jgi:dienelactone hydrolase